MKINIMSLTVAVALSLAAGSLRDTAQAGTAGTPLSFDDIDTSFVMLEVKNKKMTGMFDVSPHLAKAKSLCAVLDRFTSGVLADFETWIDEYEVGKTGTLSFTVVDVKSRDEYNKAKESVAIGEVSFERKAGAKSVTVTRKASTGGKACWK